MTLLQTIHKIVRESLKYKLTRDSRFSSLLKSVDRQQSFCNPRYVLLCSDDRQQDELLRSRNWYRGSPNEFQLRLYFQTSLEDQSVEAIS